ncbi:pyruvate dehydrogenase E1 component alpha subunit [Saccharopolyspora erythraea NRRL 2338]|uniref:2-oxoisovalerate dehydrogenase subunit alpha n=2 Tax=Saccharopolyspora erythraea TaxID=1836 RepID=A4FL03_SACEN|nr:thiamine pyrophosphate-dependent enzyme [Saccharopolyspora erythraea]EQD84136.1 pyruvate dehydrogenase E1 subunit alpha [Saccharopolyspora erythraea D]PFG98367.1 pyruvate dehydrogenase E1 component alpha subunit [Saccharopolyspora erythraea NRRL 2338]QRK88438.1 pyruvate dehydrogenase (acetyl-transferring) E1 component subunit alpha [Saccharopolyspora erythraea]CAM04728.1 putative 3-methyl-2-oxobutanoate dehydrogenase (lipoamide) E1-alpha chain [Saccharopolyspora erythraea NRRL 2338]
MTTVIQKTGATASVKQEPPRTDPSALLPEREPFRVLGTARSADTDTGLLHTLYRDVVRGRRYNQQATALAKQGRLAVYPSTTGQEACEVAAARALSPQDWIFPTYRDTLAAIVRGVDPVEALAVMRGDWHHGYDPHEHRVAPLSTPLATQLPHAVGFARAARLKGEDTVVLAMVGDGGTSEGDFHEAVNFAAVWQAPVVFLVQNNGFAISVPLAKQTAALALADKAAGYGIPGRLVDGNDVAAVHQVLTAAVENARHGGGPTLVEAVTYRIDPHTNSDDDSRYRDPSDADTWREHDPVLVLERCLSDMGVLSDADIEDAARSADDFAADLRERHGHPPNPDPMTLFSHVFAEKTSQLREQEAMVRAELQAEGSDQP